MIDLTSIVLSLAGSIARVDWRAWGDEAKVWVVFALCFVWSALGVWVSFSVFGPTITGFRRWQMGLIISVIMLGISYGAKFANTDARKKFTPVDLIQYLSQGFLWPSTWPALADFLGIQKVIPGPATSGIGLFQAIQHVLSYLSQVHQLI